MVHCGSAACYQRGTGTSACGFIILGQEHCSHALPLRLPPHLIPHTISPQFNQIVGKVRLLVVTLLRAPHATPRKQRHLDKAAGPTEAITTGVEDRAEGRGELIRSVAWDPAPSSHTSPHILGPPRNYHPPGELYHPASYSPHVVVLPPHFTDNKRKLVHKRYCYPQYLNIIFFQGLNTA